MDNIQPCLPGADILFLKHDSGILSGPTLYVVHGRAKPVLRGPNNTEPNLFHHGETTYRVGRLSETAAGMLKKKDVCSSGAFPLRSLSRSPILSASRSFVRPSFLFVRREI